MKQILVPTVLLLMTVLVSCTSDPKQVLFDQGHGQAFTVEQEGPLHLGEFSAIIAKSGLIIRSVSSELTADQFIDVDGLIISGPFKPYSKAEISAVTDFINRGGRVVIMLHVAQPMWNLLDKLGVDVANGVLREQSNLMDALPTNFNVVDFSAHTITHGLSTFDLYGGWPLRPAEEHVRTIARSSDKAWVDLNRDEILNQGDVVQQFGIIVTGTIGKGEFVVFADDAIFQNRFLGKDNRALAKNLGQWLSGK